MKLLELLSPSISPKPLRETNLTPRERISGDTLEPWRGGVEGVAGVRYPSHFSLLLRPFYASVALNIEGTASRLWKWKQK